MLELLQAMGCMSSYQKSIASNAAEIRSKEIDKSLLAEETRLSREIKLLLLGAGESGKSTILRQMRIIHGGGYTVEERLEYRQVIFRNTVQSIITIIQAMGRLGIAFSSNARKRDARLMFSLATSIDEELWSEDMGLIIQRLWEDRGVKACFMRAREYQLNDSAEYYLNSLSRLNCKDYVPTEQDVLHMRVQTLGVAEAKFSLNNRQFRMIDIGGQRTERKKWMHCFEDITAIIFVAALSEYDLMLTEDQEMNRMGESLRLFESISGNTWFHDTSIILFLNKVDIFRLKIKKTPLTVCFHEYTGSNSYEEASDYIQQKFESVSRHIGDIYPHFTCATDTSNINYVFNSVSHIISKFYVHDYELV